jgi:hypothetical protein
LHQSWYDRYDEILVEQCDGLSGLVEQVEQQLRGLDPLPRLHLVIRDQTQNHRRKSLLRQEWSLELDCAVGK